jgi:uncharacterized protein (TIGR03437 family)
MRSIFVLALFCACRLAQAQSGCPAVQFQGATTSAQPDPSSHIVVARQPDGSYTAYELANASPYRIIRTTPNYAATLDACLPHRGAGPALAPSTANFGNPPGATSQSTAYAILPSGDYLSATANGLTLDVIEFGPSIQFISEAVYQQTFSSVLFADVNGDGIPDLIGVNPGNSVSTDGSVNVMLGNGGTSFQAPQILAVSALESVSVAAADFNGDQKLDLAVASYGFAGTGGHVSIFLGNGDGTFQAEQIRFPGVGAWAIAAADLNGDGKSDLVFSSSPISQVPQTVTVALGNGDGTFSAGTSYVVTGTVSIAIGDVNGDGFPDIVTNGVSILFGDGSGNFLTRRDYLSNYAPITLFDFDGDGIIDIVAAAGNPFLSSAFGTFGIASGGTFGVLFGQGSGKFTGQPLFLVGNPSYGQAIAAADFNGDGDPDIVSASFAGTITVLAGAGDGSFTTSYQYTPQAGAGFPTALLTEDFNHDGNIDFAALFDNGNDSLLLIFLGDGDGKFQTPISVVLPTGANNFASSDFNGDGNADLAVALSDAYRSPNAVEILLGDGHGNFTVTGSYSSNAAPFSVAAGDFNGDGKPDLAIANQGVNNASQNASVSLLLGNGDGTFTAGAVIPFPSTINTGPYNIAAADFNGDGKLDLAVTTADGSGASAPSTLAVLLGNGDGTFQAPTMYNVSSADLTIADLNGDGILDLILGASYMLGNGNGTFQSEVTILSGGSGPMAAADFNRDGRVDLAGFQAGEVVVSLNISQPPPPFTVVSAASFTAGPAAPDSIVAAFGKNLTSATASAGSIPLPVTLGSTSITVAGTAAPLLYVSPSQINFEIPSGTSAGDANVVISAPGGATLTGTVTIQAVAPSLFTLNAAGLAAANVISVSNGVQTTSSVYASINVASGEVYLILYGTGIRGAAGAVRAYVQGMEVPVTFAGAQPDFPGLDQVNILLPPSLAGSGSVNIVLTAFGIESNTVSVSIQ